MRFTLAITICFEGATGKEKKLNLTNLFNNLKTMITVNWYALNSTYNDAIMKPL